MLNAIKQTKPLINFASNVFNMICPCKIRYKNSKVFEAVDIIYIWAKIDTVKVFSRFKVSLWLFSHFTTASKSRFSLVYNSVIDINQIDAIFFALIITSVYDRFAKGASRVLISLLLISYK